MAAKTMTRKKPRAKKMQQLMIDLGLEEAAPPKKVVRRAKVKRVEVKPEKVRAVEPEEKTEKVEPPKKVVRAVRTDKSKKKTKSLKVEKLELERVKKEEDHSEYKIVSKVKEKVRELERKNFKHIYVFRSKHDWWKIGGNSALIYTRLIAPGTRKNVPVIRADTDRFYPFKHGVVSLYHIDKLESELAKVGLEPKEVAEGILDFELEKPVDEEQLLLFKREKMVRDERANRLIETVIVVPELRKRIQEVNQKIWYAFNRNQGRTFAKETIMLGMLKDSLKMKKCYSRIANGFMDKEAGFKEILATANDMLTDLSFLEEVNEINITVCTSIQETLGAISSSVRAEVSKIIKAKEKEAEAKRKAETEARLEEEAARAETVVAARTGARVEAKDGG